MFVIFTRVIQERSKGNKKKKQERDPAHVHTYAAFDQVGGIQKSPFGD